MNSVTQVSIPDITKLKNLLVQCRSAVNVVASSFEFWSWCLVGRLWVPTFLTSVSTPLNVFFSFLHGWALRDKPKWWHGNIASISCQKQCFRLKYWCQCRVMGMLKRWIFQSTYWKVGRGFFFLHCQKKDSTFDLALTSIKLCVTSNRTKNEVRIAETFSGIFEQKIGEDCVPIWSILYLVKYKNSF